MTSELQIYTTARVYVVYDRNSLRTYYCLFLSVILVSVATENCMVETEQKQEIGYLFSFCC